MLKLKQQPWTIAPSQQDDTGKDTCMANSWFHGVWAGRYILKNV